MDMVEGFFDIEGASRRVAERDILDRVATGFGTAATKDEAANMVRIALTALSVIAVMGDEHSRKIAKTAISDIAQS